MTRVSLVVRAYNEEKHIGRLLEGVARQTLTDVEVVLVDSGSTDRTVPIAQGCGAKVVHIHPREFTFGRSLNLGIAAAASPLILIASAHVYPVYPDWIAHMLAPFDDPQVALTYGKQRGMQTTQYSEHQIFARWFPDAPLPQQGDTPFCNNANAAIRRSLWQQRPYDETLTGLEDLEWARWAHAQGYGIRYVPEAEIIHVHNETPRGVLNRYQREAMAFKKIYPEAHFNLYDFARMTTSNIFFDLYHAARERVLWRNLGSIFWFRAAQFWGTYQGYRRAAEWNWSLRQTFYYPRGAAAQAPPEREVTPIRYNSNKEKP